MYATNLGPASAITINGDYDYEQIVKFMKFTQHLSEMNLIKNPAGGRVINAINITSAELREQFADIVNNYQIFRYTTGFKVLTDKVFSESYDQVKRKFTDQQTYSMERVRQAKTTLIEKWQNNVFQDRDMGAYSARQLAFDRLFTDDETVTVSLTKDILQSVAPFHVVCDDTLLNKLRQSVSFEEDGNTGLHTIRKSVIMFVPNNVAFGEHTLTQPVVMIQPFISKLENGVHKFDSYVPYVLSNFKQFWSFKRVSYFNRTMQTHLQVLEDLGVDVPPSVAADPFTDGLAMPTTIKGHLVTHFIERYDEYGKVARSSDLERYKKLMYPSAAVETNGVLEDSLLNQVRRTYEKIAELKKFKQASRSGFVPVSNVGISFEDVLADMGSQENEDPVDSVLLTTITNTVGEKRRYREEEEKEDDDDEDMTSQFGSKRDKRVTKRRK